MTIVVATRNPDKVAEIAAILTGLDVALVALDRIDHAPVVIEDGRSVEENALKKARAVRDHTGMCALADDTALEVDALHGAPGVFSARYAGENGDYTANNRKLLEELSGVPEAQRTARFRCVMALALPARIGESLYDRMGEAGGMKGVVPVVGASRVDAIVAEGILEGRVTREKRGTAGFGYDPVFEVPERGKTLAELGPEGKNRISHRYRALCEVREMLLRWGIAKVAVQPAR